MSRIPIPATIDAAPAASQPLLEAVKKQLGVAPNLFRLVANSPAALEGYLGLTDALGKGTLPRATRERIALAVAEINGCDYCLSAHTYLGQEPRQARRRRDGGQPRRVARTDAKADAAVALRREGRARARPRRRRRPPGGQGRRLRRCAR